MTIPPMPCKPFEVCDHYSYKAKCDVCRSQWESKQRSQNVFTNEEIAKLDYEQIAKRIVNQCDTPEELRAAIAKTLDQVSMWSFNEGTKYTP